MPRGKPQYALREKFNKLRRQGKTYSEIIKILKTVIPKGTLSHWSSKITLSAPSLKKLQSAREKALLKAQEISRKIRKEKHQHFLQELRSKNNYLVNKIDQDVARLLLSMLYLGEGSKYAARSGLALGSSDPGIIKLFIALLERCYGKSLDQLRCWLSYRADQQIDDLIAFWSKATGIPVDQFYQTKPDPRTLGKRTSKKDYKGVCVVHCLKSTIIQLELETISKMVIEGL